MPRLGLGLGHSHGNASNDPAIDKGFERSSRPCKRTIQKAEEILERSTDLWLGSYRRFVLQVRCRDSLLEF